MKVSNGGHRRGRRLSLLVFMVAVMAACGTTTDDETPDTEAASTETVSTEGETPDTTTADGETASDGSGATLTIGWTWDPGTMDPQMHRQRYTQIISHAMRDKLFYQEPPGLQYVPLLAESISQVDETTYEVKLREGVLFHNGDELTAEDVVFTFERLWDPATESPRASMGNMSNVEGIEAVDDYTVRWTTAVPFGPAEQAAVGLHLGGQEILHKATYENLSMEEAGSGDGLVGVGPFQLVEWTPDQHVIMEAFEDYWQGTPSLDQIIWRTIPEEATRVSELLAGSVDMIHPVGPDSVDQLEAAGMKIETQPGTSTNMLQMNVQEGSPFADVEIRKAMNMAIDKEAIVDSIYAGLAVPYEHIAGVNQEGHIEGYDPFDYDPEAAGEVLSQVTEPIELIVEERFQLPAEAIAEQLRGLGMDVTAVVVDDATHDQMQLEGDFNLLFGGAGYGSGDFTGAYYNNHFECARFETDRIRTGFCSEELDEQMDAIRAETDQSARAEMLDDLIRELSEDHAPWVPLFGTSEVWAMQPYVEGFVGSPAGQMFDLWQVTVDR